MAPPRPFRFAVQTSKPPGGDLAAHARKVEDLGYSTLFMPDHFGDQLAPVPALMAAADATVDLRVGSLVFDNDYKHPVVLAKEAATIDLLSGGRFEFGLGAGWETTDYEQSGIPKERDGVRIARMAEAVEVLKGLWGPGAFSFSGQHYTITGLDGMPKPAQQPHPPILIGGGGPKVLGIAARHADIVGINHRCTPVRSDPTLPTTAAADRVDQKVAWFREAAGDRIDEIEINALVFIVNITDDPDPVREMMAGIFGVPADLVAETPYVWIGSIPEICDQLRAARERWGFSYFVVQGDAFESVAPVVAELAGT